MLFYTIINGGTAHADDSQVHIFCPFGLSHFARTTISINKFFIGIYRLVCTLICGIIQTTVPRTATISMYLFGSGVCEKNCLFIE